MLQELFKRVIPNHCLGAVWARRDRKLGKGGNIAPSVLATIDQFNRVSLRVIATILRTRELKSSLRAKILQKWIDIAQVGYILKMLYKNYWNAVIGILLYCCCFIISTGVKTAEELFLSESHYIRAPVSLGVSSQEDLGLST